MNKKITLRLDLTSKTLIALLAAALWCNTLKPFTISSEANAQSTEGPRVVDPRRFAPPLWNSLGRNQILCSQELDNLVRNYNYTRDQAYLHCILWEISALERRGAGNGR